MVCVAQTGQPSFAGLFVVIYCEIPIIPCAESIVVIDLTLILGFLAAGFVVVGWISAVLAVMETRTSQGAVAWSVGLISFPFLFVPLYWLFGRKKFAGYVKTRQMAEDEVHAWDEIADVARPDVSNLPKSNLGTMHALENLAEMPFTRGNDIRLLIDGEATFSAIEEAIERAGRYVLFQFYILRDDELGRRLRDLLIAAAERGAKVCVLYDEIGSNGTSRAYFDMLKAAGVSVSAFNSNLRSWNRTQLNFRNHRKIVVIDGDVAFVGGHNVGDEYLGKSQKFGNWRDTHVAIEGPAVKGTQVSFVEDWYWATGEHLELDWSLEKASDADKVALILATGPADKLESCGLFFVQAINAAVDRIWIVSPYYVPDVDVVVALQLAALRGVDVRIIIPDKADHLIVWLAAFSYFKDAGKGIRFYRYTDGFLHQKVMLVDDIAAAVGTANLDNRSFRLNFEITVLTIDQTFAGEVEEMLEADLARCRLYEDAELERRPFWFKFAVKAARLAAPIL